MIEENGYTFCEVCQYPISPGQRICYTCRELMKGKKRR